MKKFAKLAVFSTLGIAVTGAIGILAKKEHGAIGVGDRVPDFSLLDQNGQAFDITTVRGSQKMVIYFYPKDETPGCTKEACTFRDHFAEFEDVGALVIGISADSPESHAAFALKHNLDYVLLSDIDNKVRQLFDVPTDMFGLIPGRVTYVVDAEGFVRHVFNSQMNVTRHVEEALEILRSL